MWRLVWRPRGASLCGGASRSDICAGARIDTWARVAPATPSHALCSRAALVRRILSGRDALAASPRDVRLASVAVVAARIRAAATSDALERAALVRPHGQPRA